MMHNYSYLRNGTCGFGFMNGGYGLFNILMIVGFLLLVVALVLYIIKRQNYSTNSLEEKLKLAYINGEITEEEYFQKKKVLEMK